MKIEELKNYTPVNYLEEEVIETIISGGSNYKSFEQYLEDLINNGCGGMISSLNSHSDITDFTRRNSKDINELVSNQLSILGLTSPIQLFNEKWDEEDNLCLDKHNQQIISYFAFVETAKNIANSLDLELAA